RALPAAGLANSLRSNSKAGKPRREHSSLSGSEGGMPSRMAVPFSLPIRRNALRLLRPTVELAPLSPLARRVQGGFAGEVRSCCPSEASSGPAGESARSEGTGAAGETAGRVSLLPFLPRSKKVGRPPGRVPAGRGTYNHHAPSNETPINNPLN